MRMQTLALTIPFLLWGGSNASADPVNIVNFSFETAVGSNIPGWGTATGGRGRISDVNETDGSWALYLNPTGNRARQTLDGLDRFGETTTEVILADNTQYSLTVDVGNRNPAQYGGWLIQLEAWNPDTLAWEAIAQTAGDPDDPGITHPTDNNFVEVNLDFLTGTDPILGLDGVGTDLRGQPMAIILGGFEPIQTVFDNVRLDVTEVAPVPEPGSLALWGLFGIAGLAYAQRRRAAYREQA